MNDMERGRLASQHGEYSQVVANYDRQVAERKQSEAFDWHALNGPPNPLDVTSGSHTHAGTAGGGDAVAKLLGFAGILAALYGAYLFAIEASKALWLAWTSVLGAVASPGAPGHPALILCFVASGLAVWTVLRRMPRFRALPRAVQAGLVLLPLPVSQLLLWLLGSLLLVLPLLAAELWPLQRAIAASLPDNPALAAKVATVGLASGLLIVGLPLVHLLWRGIDRIGMSGMEVGLLIRARLADRRLAGVAAVGVATALLLAFFAITNPPLAMPFGIWPYGALIVGALFGWKVALAATLLAIAIGQPGYQEAASSFPDGSGLRRAAIWWAGLLGTGVAAGALRPTLPSPPARDIRMALWATLLGLVAGCLMMMAIEVAQIGTGLLWRLVVDYWFDFVPRYAMGYAASAAIGALVAMGVRNAGFGWARRVERERAKSMTAVA